MRGRPGDDAAVLLKGATVAGAGDHSLLRLPYRQTAQMSADRAQRVEAGLVAYDKNAVTEVQRDRPHRVVLRPADVDRRRRLVEHAGAKVLQPDNANARSGHRYSR